MVLQSSMTLVFRQGSERGRLLREGLKFGSAFRFVPGRVSKRFVEGDGLDRVRMEARIGVRPPRLALVSVIRSLLLLEFGLVFVNLKLQFLVEIGK